MSDNTSNYFLIPTMKSLDGTGKSTKAVAAPAESVSEAPAAAPVVEEIIDFTGVEIEPLFAEAVDFETFSKSDFRAVKVKDCVAVPKSKKLLRFTVRTAKKDLTLLW